MKKLIIFKGEIIKIHKNEFISIGSVFSMLLWPIISYFEVYFTYLSFDLSFLKEYGINDHTSLMIFIITGFLGYNCFWSMVQSAWSMGYERQNGTLEIIMLSPANRLSILFGRALGALVENIWMFFVFSVFIISYKIDVTLIDIVYLLIALIILLISSVIWGGFMNSLFLFSRDASFLFNIFDTPMEFFGGVKIPVSIFPFWAKLISAVFPLTYCLILIREIIFYHAIKFSTLIPLFYVLIIIFIITLIITKNAEKNCRKTGSFQFY